jgi:DNA invertase Pin-like site-specific DNA recombinase
MTALLIGYARVSTDAQDLTAQREGLLALGVEPGPLYVDHGLTGTNRERPGLREALAACREGDTLMVTKLDRLARSLPDARAIAEELTVRQVRLSLGGSVYDPHDPVGRLLFNVLAMVAEFESDPIRQAVARDENVLSRQVRPLAPRPNVPGGLRRPGGGRPVDKDEVARVREAADVDQVHPRRRAGEDGSAAADRGASDHEVKLLHEPRREQRVPSGAAAEDQDVATVLGLELLQIPSCFSATEDRGRLRANVVGDEAVGDDNLVHIAVEPSDLPLERRRRRVVSQRGPESHELLKGGASGKQGGRGPDAFHVVLVEVRVERQGHDVVSGPFEVAVERHEVADHELPHDGSLAGAVGQRGVRPYPSLNGPL